MSNNGIAIGDAAPDTTLPGTEGSEHRIGEGDDSAATVCCSRETLMAALSRSMRRPVVRPSEENAFIRDTEERDSWSSLLTEARSSMPWWLSTCIFPAK